ncbi:MarR family winged helix-turn-helix transcriptional regulator [Leptospira licerasiae]|uniref:Organic hydroperoxide resistance transcriptional regulator n=1 Tax=Leptospira licerasiae str. MMD4847 TaxID=1049971 RepID=A0ABP2RE01_9LEPT|nr:MarR family transcriptional regulator [Leptospira licerasiae]EIE02282.1 organic hydroperoxide resistance transcriptional regulator [Leptospira licerasiae serovar Varillal str. VAR 010]EJZ42598.1 organic hydroperoxide resistance transcriptional regulator [Leptospira licerasiae str. MMD4847]TGM90685.1 MarR family transcriptional regulator [Leptospira licerasiae]
MNYESLKLEKQICFPLYASSRAVTALYRPLLEEFGITYPQYLVLLVLWETDRIPLKEIGEKLFLDSGTLTPLLKKMESAGLLTRDRSDLDERSLVVSLTTKGKKLQKKAVCIPERLLEESGLTTEKVQGLKRDLDDLLIILDQKLRNSA